MENSRLVQLKQVMSVEEAMSFAGAMIQAVTQVVGDKLTRVQIAQKFRSLLGENALWRRQSWIAAFGTSTGVLDELETQTAPASGAVVIDATQPGAVDPLPQDLAGLPLSGG